MSLVTNSEMDRNIQKNTGIFNFYPPIKLLLQAFFSLLP